MARVGVDFTGTQPHEHEVDIPTIRPSKRTLFCVTFYMLLMKIIHFVCDFYPQLHAQIRQLRLILHTIESTHRWLVAGAEFSI